MSVAGPVSDHDALYEAVAQALLLASRQPVADLDEAYEWADDILRLDDDPMDSRGTWTRTP